MSGRHLGGVAPRTSACGVYSTLSEKPRGSWTDGYRETSSRESDLLVVLGYSLRLISKQT